MDARQGRIVELRFFGGLSIDETADVLSLSAATVERSWASARAWLYRQLKRNARIMTGERWQEVKTVLEAALQMDSEKRRVYLDQACASDQSLRREVESLLAADRAGAVQLSAIPTTGNQAGKRHAARQRERHSSWIPITCPPTGALGSVIRKRATPANWL